MSLRNSLAPSFFAILATLAGLSCASMRFGYGEKRTYGDNGNMRAWSIPCREDATEKAYEILLSGKGNPGAAMYYMRCREPNEWLIYLRSLRRPKIWTEEERHDYPEQPPPWENDKWLDSNSITNSKK